MDSQGYDSAAGPAPNDGAIDLPRLMSSLARRKWWILTPTALAFGAALVFVTIASPRYSASTKVMLENQESYFTRPEKASADGTTSSIFDAEGVQSEAETVATDELARKAVAKLGLVKSEEFNPEGHGVMAFVESLLGGHPYAEAEDRAVENFLKHVTVFALAKSRVLQIEFSSKDPQLAAEGANTVAALYLAAKADARKEETHAGAVWLSGQIDNLRGKVAEADAKVESYRGETGLLNGANSMTLPTQQLAEITTQIANARASQSAATSKAQLLRQMLREGRLDAVADVAKDESLRRYAELRVGIKAQIAEESRTLLGAHPKMQELQGKLIGLESEMRAAATKVVGGLEDEGRLASQQVASLEAAISKQSRAVALSNGDEVKLHALELDAKTAREQLESYEQKYREAVAHQADNAMPPNARVTAKAVVPRTPVFPKKVPTVLLSTLAGFFLSAGAVVARALLVDSPSGGSATAAPSRVARREDIPEAAEAPIASAPASGSPLDDFVDTLVGLATPGACAPLLVAGDGAHGALSIALTAARRLSKSGRTVLLDLGQSQPWLNDVFDRDFDEERDPVGMSDWVAGRASFGRCVHRDLSSTLDILPAGPEAVDADSAGSALAALTSNYDFVVAHASDWRSDAAIETLSSIAAVVLCAPASQLPRMQEQLRRALPDPSIVVKGVPTALERADRERAA